MMRICFIKLDHVHVKYVTLFMSDVCFYSRPLSQESGAMLLLSFVLIHSTARISVCIFIALLSKSFSMHHRPLATEPWQSGAFTMLQTTVLK